MQKTVLYDEHIKAGGNMVDFAGWQLPVFYTSIKEEAVHVRQNIGLFDVSHMGEFFISGADAQKFVNYIITNNTIKKDDFSIVYTVMCDQQGYAIDDLLVYKFDNQNFLLIVNAVNIDKDLNWLEEQKSGFNIEINNRSDDYSLLAIQGPKSLDLLNEFFPGSVDDLKYYHFTESKFAHIDCLLSRTGYTGEKGFEIMVLNEQAVDMWRMISEKKDQYDLKYCGLGARDLLRIEAGFPLYGHELNEKINPYEANLGWVIKLDKENDFIGKEALKEYKDKQNRVRIGFIMEKSKIAREGSGLFNDKNEKVGFVTSGTYSFALAKSIGMGVIEKKYIDIEKLKINISEKIFNADISNLPFIPLKN